MGAHLAADAHDLALDGTAIWTASARMRALHQALDRLNGWIVARRPQAPVASTPTDLEALAALDPGALHAPVVPVELHLTRENRPPIRTDYVVFASPTPSGDPANDRVHGVRWRASVAKATTAVIMLHGGFAPGFTAEKLIAPPFLARGMDVFAPALPWHMERAPAISAYSGQYPLSGDVPRLVHGFAQGAQDAAALALGLRAVGYERVFAGGISLGGNIAAQLASIARLDGIYLLIPAVDPFVTIWQTPIGAGTVRAARQAGFPEVQVARAMRLITPHLLGPPRTPAARILVVHGRHDLLCPPEPITTLVRSWGISDVRRFAAGHRSFGLHLFTIRKDLARALDGFAPIGDTNG